MPLWLWIDHLEIVDAILRDEEDGEGRDGGEQSRPEDAHGRRG